MCSYNLLPVECKGSAARIRILEHRLVKARECIGELQRAVPQDVPTEPHQSIVPQRDLDALRLPPRPPFRAPTSFNNPSKAGNNRPVAITLSLIQCLLQPLSRDDGVKSLINSSAAHSILRDSGLGNEVPHNRFYQLPPYDTMIEVIYAAFNSIFTLCNVVSEQDFRVASQRLYDINPVSYTSEDTEFVPLFCGVTALGMIYCSEIHQQLGYEKVLKERYVASLLPSLASLIRACQFALF